MSPLAPSLAADRLDVSEPNRTGARPFWFRLVLMVVLFVLVSGVTNAVNTAVDGVPVLALLFGFLTAGASVWVYRKVVGYTEHRPVAELDPGNARSGLRNGFLLGLGLFTATITVIAIFGGYRITGWGSLGAAVSAIGLMACVAVTEEILLRGIVFRLIEEKAGTVGALVFSAVIFGGLHLINPEATVWGALAIAIEAGLMLGAAYVATRSLWLPIGLHLGWNLAEGGLFATTVSGSNSGETGLFHSVMSGSSALTGGSFGPEASIVAILACAVPTVYFLRLAARRGNLRARGSVSTVA
jgi:membrane protease YdiL (CAAX protease family)